MKKFLELLEKFKEESTNGTTGNALSIFINCANNTPFALWEEEDLDETSRRIENHLKEVGEW